MESTGMTWRKSTYSNGGSSACVEVATWRKATYSNGGENCVETASGSGVVLVRDTTDRDGGTLTFGAGVWERFIASLR